VVQEEVEQEEVVESEEEYDLVHLECLAQEQEQVEQVADLELAQLQEVE
jgi:hypothetical protein